MLQITKQQNLPNNMLKHSVCHLTRECCAGCTTQAFSATNGVNTAVGTVGSFTFTGWNYDVQVQSGFRAIYRLNDQATFKVDYFLG